MGFLDLSAGDLKDWLSGIGEPTYRAAQIRQWIFARRAESFDRMTDLPRSLRRQLTDHGPLFTANVVNRRVAEDGTEKLVLQFPDGGRIECVLIREVSRRTICVSTQVGCAMGCVFCASGLDGVERNLTTGEIVEQMLRLQALLPVEERLSHIVVMGMGEPLANLGGLLPALEAARAEDGLGISARRITISTVGLPPAMKRLAEAGVPYRLAVSLHAPDDALRDRLVPVNAQTGIAPILEAADHYYEVTGRRLTFEYVLLAGINDDASSARRLVGLLRDRNALLNVIPYNPVAGLPYRTPSAAAVHAFRAILEQGGIAVKFRQRKGDRIDAACGQLRRVPVPS